MQFLHNMPDKLQVGLSLKKAHTYIETCMSSLKLSTLSTKECPETHILTIGRGLCNNKYSNANSFVGKGQKSEATGFTSINSPKPK